nr:MAG TPA: hypothetical protein [Bacteriophage sp.]
MFIYTIISYSYCFSISRPCCIYSLCRLRRYTS